MRTNRPTAPAVEKKYAGEIVAPAFGQPLPAEAAIIAAHHQTIAARRPAGVLVRKINRDQPRRGANAGRQPKSSAVSRAQYEAVGAGNPAVPFV